MKLTLLGKDPYYKQTPQDAVPGQPTGLWRQGTAGQAETHSQNLNHLPVEVHGLRQRIQSWAKPGGILGAIAHPRDAGPMHLRFVENPAIVMREKQNKMTTKTDKQTKFLKRETHHFSNKADL